MRKSRVLWLEENPVYHEETSVKSVSDKACVAAASKRGVKERGVKERGVKGNGVAHASLKQTHAYAHGLKQTRNVQRK
jgi:sulfur relay (sulfurtransferase) complex TusBCD TusD component (DsrE family)